MENSMQLVKMNRTGELKIIDTVSKSDDNTNYHRQVKVYNYEKLKTFNYEQVSKTSLNRCLEEVIDIMSPTLPYTVLEDYEVSFVPIEKYLITISKKDEV